MGTFSPTRAPSPPTIFNKKGIFRPLRKRKRINIYAHRDLFKKYGHHKKRIGTATPTLAPSTTTTRGEADASFTRFPTQTTRSPSANGNKGYDYKKKYARIYELFHDFNPYAIGHS